MSSPPLAVAAAVSAALAPFARQFVWSTTTRAAVTYGAGPAAALAPSIGLNALCILLIAYLLITLWASKRTPILSTCGVGAFVFIRICKEGLLLALLCDASGGISLNKLCVYFFVFLVCEYFASRSLPMLFTCAVCAFVIVRIFGKWVLVTLLLEASSGSIFALQQALAIAQLVSFVAFEAAAVIVAGWSGHDRNRADISMDGLDPGPWFVFHVREQLMWLAKKSVWYNRYARRRAEEGGVDAAFVMQHAILLALNAGSLALLHFLINFPQPCFSHHVGGVFFEGDVSSSSLSFWADIMSWSAAAKLPELLGLREMAAKAYDLRLMAGLPPILFMKRRELFVFKVLASSPRGLLIVGDTLLRAFGILAQFRCSGLVGDTFDSIGALALAGVPVLGSLMMWLGLRMAGVHPLSGIYLRFLYNSLVLGFVLVSFLPLGNSGRDTASSTEPTVKAFKVRKKFGTYAWGAAAVFFLLAMEVWMRL